MSNDPHQPSIGEEGRKVREKMRFLKQREDIANTERIAQVGGVARQGDPTLGTEHYHLCFQIVGETEMMPMFQMAYPTPRTAYIEVKRLGEESEPNTEWGQDGRVQIETPLAGRTGLWRVIIQVAGCQAKRCQAKKKRSGLLLPSRMN